MQWSTGGRPAVKCDFRVLERSAWMFRASGECYVEALKSVRALANCLEAISPYHWEQAGVLSFSIIYRIHEQSIENSALRYIYDKIVSSTPPPCFLPVVSSFAPAGQELESEVHFSTRCVDYSPCGRYLAVGTLSGDVVVLNAETRDIIERLKFHKCSVTAVKFNSSSFQIASAADEIALWNWESNETPSMVLRGHTYLIFELSWSSDDLKLFSASSDGTVKIWDLARESCVATISIPGEPFALYAREDIVVFEKIDPNKMVVAELIEDGLGAWKTYLREIDIQDVQGVRGAAFSMKGKYLASGYPDGHIEVLRTDDWTPAFEPLRGHSDAVHSLHFSKDSKYLASASEDGFVCLWNAETGQILGVAEAPKAVRLGPYALSGNGKRVLVLMRDEKFVLYNALTGDKILQIGAPEGVRSIALDHYGRQAAHGKNDGTIQVWNSAHSPDNGKHWKIREGGVKCFSFSFNGERIVSCGDDEFIRIWDLTTEEQVGFIECQLNDLWFDEVAFSADDSLIICTDCSCGEMKIWKTGTQELVFRNRTSAIRPHGLSTIEVALAVRNCGPKSIHMASEYLERVAGDVFINQGSVYYVSANDAEDGKGCEKKLLAVVPDDNEYPRWEFSSLQGTLVMNENGRLLIIRLVQ